MIEMQLSKPPVSDPFDSDFVPEDNANISTDSGTEEATLPAFTSSEQQGKNRAPLVVEENETFSSWFKNGFSQLSLGASFNVSQETSVSIDVSREKENECRAIGQVGHKTRRQKLC